MYTLLFLLIFSHNALSMFGEDAQKTLSSWIEKDNSEAIESYITQLKEHTTQKQEGFLRILDFPEINEKLEEKAELHNKRVWAAHGTFANWVVPFGSLTGLFYYNLGSTCSDAQAVYDLAYKNSETCSFLPEAYELQKTACSDASFWYRTGLSSLAMLPFLLAGLQYTYAEKPGKTARALKKLVDLNDKLSQQTLQ